MCRRSDSSSETNPSYKDIPEDVEKRLDTSNYDVRKRKRPLPKGKNKKVMSNA